MQYIRKCTAQKNFLDFTTVSNDLFDVDQIKKMMRVP